MRRAIDEAGQAGGKEKVRVGLAWADFWVRGFRGSPLGGFSVFTAIRMATKSN